METSINQSRGRLFRLNGFESYYKFTREKTIDISPHVRKSKTVLDSGFHAVDSRFQVLDSSLFLVELGFWIPIFSGIPDSLSCIPGSQAKLPRVPARILQAKISRNTESGFPYGGQTYAVSGVA